MISQAVFIVCFLTALIHFIETSAYSLRIAGVKTKKIATALSLITSILLVSRLSNMCQAPILGLLVDETILINSNAALQNLIKDFRWIIFSAFLGSLLGGLLLPLSVKLYTECILNISKGNNLLFAFMKAIPKMGQAKHFNFKSSLVTIKQLFNIKTLPKSFLVLNVCVTAVYTIGVLCSLLAGAILPEFRSTAIQLSGIVNGIGTLLLATMVDPIGARITDQVASAERPEVDIFKVVFYLVCGRLLGTLVIAQLLFLPLSEYIKSATLLLIKLF